MAKYVKYVTIGKIRIFMDLKNSDVLMFGLETFRTIKFSGKQLPEIETSGIF